jgi:F-box and WD-40 domain protein 1/11
MTSAPDSNVVLPSRRRLSSRLKTRPRTALFGGGPTQNAVWSQTAAWNAHQAIPSDTTVSPQDTNDVFEDEYSGQVLEETHLFPEPSARRRSAKSFSSLRHGVDGLHALGRRLSVTIRRKSPKHNLHIHPGEAYLEEPTAKHQVNSGSWDGKSKSCWRRGHSVNRRPSLHSISALQGFYASVGYITQSAPRNGYEPPILPDDFCGGAAARAAAAAQNEMAKAKRIISRGDSVIHDLKLTRDSESGIEIDIRDRSEISDDETTVVRIGKTRITSSSCRDTDVSS